MRVTVGRSFAVAMVAGLVIAFAQPLARQSALAAEACPQVSEAAIVGLFDRWNASLAAGEPDGVAKLYAEDAVLLPVLGERPYVGREDIRDYFAQFLAKHPQGSVTERSITVTCNTATDAGMYVYRVTGRRRGTRMLLGGRYRTDYERRNGDWLIVRHDISGMFRAQSSTKDLRNAARSTQR